MSISMRELFGRQGIPDEVISLRNSLANHPNGLAIGLREAKQRLSKLADGNGFARGCRRPGTKIGDLFGVTEFRFPADIDPLLALPEWVPVAGKTELVHDRTEEGRTVSFLREDYAGETRTVEGILTKSKITHTDVPFKPWHVYYDWNFHIKVDPQYTYI